VLTYDGDPGAPTSLRSRNFWQSLPARFLRIVPQGSMPAGRQPGETQEAGDVEGKLAPWFKEHDAGIVVLRPDRYVFGVFPAGGTAAAEQALRAAQLGL
jgi:3-(3-hydroxy-phenyl)propionate hydroxylase